MGRATLSFKLPEEKDEFLLAQRGGDYYCAIMEMKNVFRDVRKYGKKVEDAFTECEQIVHDCQTEDIQ